MLVLTRKIDQEILIGTHGEIQIKVLSVQGNHVKIGVKADQQIPVNRKEVFELQQQQHGHMEA